MANVNLRAKETGKKKTGEVLRVLSPSHGPLRFITSHSRFALAFIRDQAAKNEAPEEEAVVKAEGFNSFDETNLTSMTVKRNRRVRI